MLRRSLSIQCEILRLRCLRHLYPCRLRQQSLGQFSCLVQLEYHFTFKQCHTNKSAVVIMIPHNHVCDISSIQQFNKQEVHF